MVVTKEELANPSQGPPQGDYMLVCIDEVLGFM